MAHLLRHGGTKDLEQDFQQWGAPPPEVLAALEQSDEFELWPENAEPLRVFMRLQTQWRYGPAGPTGLDYAGVRVALEWLGVKVSPALFEDVQLMESATLKILAEARN